MTLLDIALGCIARGWYVLPCAPRDKNPLIKGAYKNASNDEAQIRAWWEHWPDANVGIAVKQSGLTVLDIDKGLSGPDDLDAVCGDKGLPPTFAVRTGGRPEFKVQLYYAGEGVKSIAWEDGDIAGDIRGTTGHVMAAGSIHPSGETYAALWELPIVPVPNYVRALKPRAIPGVVGGENPKLVDDGGPITEWRNVHLISLLGKKRGEGASDDELREYAVSINETRMQPPLDDEELERIVGNACKFPIPEADPVPILSGKKEPERAVTDWRMRYMTAEAFANTTPPEFLIDGFLVKGSITMLAGPVAQRKSIVALNIAHALCTGDPLFGYFHVSECPERVVYLCPEMGAHSFVKRVKQIGLSQYVGTTLFCQTMSDESTGLGELDGELPGAVVIVDTITRFVEGNENDSADMRLFAQKAFRLCRAGATVILLHHSKKGSLGTLDDGLRGSSELAAFVDSCWVTELEDVKRPYESLSKMRNVKQRDFESDPFQLKPAKDSYYLTMDGEPAPEAVIKGKKEDAARVALAAILKDSPKMGINKLRDALKAKGHGRGQQWVTRARGEILGAGVTLSSD
jgi:hypothetical protein